MPTYLLLKGPMGVGKSATARALGKKWGWCVLDKDDASDSLLNHLDSYGALSYQIMFAYAENLVKQGFSVIVDSPLRGELGYQRAAAFAHKNAISLKILELYCSDQAEWQRRLETRQKRPAHVIEHWSDFEAYWLKAKQDFEYELKHPYLQLDTVNPLEGNILKIETWLKQ